MLYFPDFMLDLVYIWYDDRYRSTALFSNIPHAHGFMVKAMIPQTLMFKFYIKISNSSYLPDCSIDVRYQPEVLFSNTLTHTYDLKVRRFGTFVSKFDIKVLNSAYFPDHLGYIWYDMMIIIGPRFNSAIPLSPPPPPHDTHRLPKSLDFLCKMKHWT